MNVTNVNGFMMTDGLNIFLDLLKGTQIKRPFRTLVQVLVRFSRRRK